MKKNRLLFLSILMLAAFTLAFGFQASSAVSESFGDPKAIRGGQLNLNTPEFPKSFNYYVNGALDAHEVFAFVYDTLLEWNPTSLEYSPLLAKSWNISADKKEFTFTLDPRAKWADGRPVTTADVQFTYDTIMNPKNLTSVQRMAMGRFDPPQVVDKYTIKFKAKNVHFKNMEVLAGLNVLPKHRFAGKDFNRAFNMNLPAGSGPYILSEVKEGRYYVMARNKKYWAASFPQHKGMYNFDRIKIRMIADTAAFEAFKKGDFDIYQGISAKDWVTRTNVKPFQNHWIIKQKVYNYSPQGFTGMAFNQRLPIFQDRRVRLAICHLIDRKTILEKITFNQYQPLTSYFPSLYGSDPSNPLIGYDSTKAKQLLKEAGYTRLDKDGYLINQKGQRMEFTISYQGESLEKHLTLIKETCRQAGVKVNLELLSWATLLKKVDEFKFEAVLFAWTGVLFEDPEQLWHSRHAKESGSSNLPGYKNPEVDRLIDSLPPIFDVAQRKSIMKKIDALIYQDVPYALFWGANYNRVLYKNIFGMPRTVFTKYGEGITEIISYWWIDPAKEKRYREAVRRNRTLPGVPEEIYYDRITGKK